MKIDLWTNLSTAAVRRSLVTVVALLLPFPRLLLLPGLAGAFLTPTSAVSSAASRSSGPSSSVASSAGSKVTPSHRLATSKTNCSAPKNTDNNSDGGDDPNSSGGEREASMTPPLPPQQQLQLQLQQHQDEAVSTAGASAAIAARQFQPPREITKTVASARLNCNALGRNGVGMQTAGNSRVGVAMKAKEEEAEVRSGFVEPDAALARKGGGEGAAMRLWNLPNVLTVARIIAIPFFAAVFFSGLPKRNVWCAAIFGGAALTDWFDGYLARTQGLETPFGAFLDPVADKLMVSTALILLCERLGPWMTICSAIILCRELAVSALREWMAQLGMREKVKVGNAGKWKTATQMIALGLLLLLEPGASVTLVDPVVFMPLARALLYVSTILTVTSGSGYLVAAWPTLIGRPPRRD